MTKSFDLQTRRQHGAKIAIFQLPAEPAEALPQTTRSAAVLAFVQARQEAHRIMRDAAKIAGLPDLCRAQADAIAGLAGLKLHRIHGQPDAADFLALRDDLEAIADKVDPLILMIGDEAAGGVTGVDLTQFEDQISGAINGNATHELEQAAERLTGDLQAAE